MDGDEDIGPWPDPVEPNVGAAGTANDAGGDVEQRVAKPAGLGHGQFRILDQGLDCGEQHSGEQNQLDPGAVGVVVGERQPGQARSLRFLMRFST